MGIGIEKVLTTTGAQATKDFDMDYLFGSNYLTHPRGWR